MCAKCVAIPSKRQHSHFQVGTNEDTQSQVVAPSVEQDTAVAVADQDAAMSEADLVWRRDAIKWATQNKNPSFTVHLVDTLPPAVLDEQVRSHQASRNGPVVPRAPSEIHGVPTRAEVEVRSGPIA